MNSKKIKDIIFQNKVVILFVVLCVGASIASGQSINFILPELFTRIARNSFIVLALIIPVVAGMGLNFGIVIGAISAQIAVFLTTHWGFVGIGGFGLTVLLATPMAIILGALVGILFNQMKGNEMIAGLVLGYFAEGFYQLLFLFIFGGVIPIKNDKLMIETGVGVKNTIDLKDTIKYSLETVPMLTILEVGFFIVLIAIVVSTIFKLVKKEQVNWKDTIIKIGAAIVVYALSFVPAIEDFLATDRLVLLDAITIGVIVVVIWHVFQIIRHKMNKELHAHQYDPKRSIVYIVLAVAVYAITYVPAIEQVTLLIKLPVMTYLCIGGLCVFNNALMSTRLGQNMRTVGQSRVVANAAGINVNRTRIIAMILSTVLASWGQLIFLQNVGTFSTYGAHTQVGQFAIAALLVGGASVDKATNKHALLGIVLFHWLFIVSPLAGKELFGDAAIGEYFRVFVSYGVIAMALAMHAWKQVKKPKTEEAAE